MERELRDAVPVYPDGGVEFVRLGLGEKRPVDGGVVDYGPELHPVLWDMHYELEMGVVMDGRMLLLLPAMRASTASGAVQTSVAAARIRPAIKLVFESRTLVSNQDAASACSMSREHFIRTFERIMGVTFVQFSLRHRLSGAAEELRSTAAPLKQAAKDWGFTDSNHLIRQFLRHYRVSPTAYRNSKGKGASFKTPRKP